MKKTIIVFILSTLSILGCSSAEKQNAELDSQIEAQKPADTPESIVQRAAENFSNVDGLTAAQKAKLSETYTQVYFKSIKLRREIGQSKSLLFATLAKPNYLESDITKLKKKIISLDQQRLLLMFKALDDVQAIVGKGTTNAEKIYKHFEDYEIPSRYLKDYNTN